MFSQVENSTAIHSLLMNELSNEMLDVSSASPSFSFSITEGLIGLRLDHFLVRKFPHLSRSQLSVSIDMGLVRVDGQKRKNSYRLKLGEEVAGMEYVAPVIEIIPEKISFDILFEDQFLLVISKPPNLVVHPGSGNLSGTLVNGLVHHCQAIGAVGDPIRPGIVHRLDKDTSGVMVIAKDDHVLRKLSMAFKEREVKKNYLALLHGVFEKKEGRIVAPIGRHSINRKKMAIREPSGKYAVSNWGVIEEIGGKYSLVNIGIETGRTHQIRVHMAHLGHPVAGDLLYGGKGRPDPIFPRQLLHASKLFFVHPMDKREMSFKATLWPDFESVVEELRQR